MTIRKALIVGISDYADKRPTLPGCLRDAMDWRNVLTEKLGFAPDSIRLLRDERASMPATKDNLAWLLGGAGKDDHLVFVFAGHGARVLRRDSDTGDLLDGIDEALVCHPGKDEDYLLYDDDLVRFGKKSEARLTIILDSCYSGGMARRDNRIETTGSRAPIARSVGAPIEPGRRRSKPGDIRRFGVFPHTENLGLLTISAANEVESAWDADMPDGQSHGVFSYFATLALQESPDLSFEDLIENVAPKIAAKYPQHPMLFGVSSRVKQNFLD